MFPIILSTLHWPDLNPVGPKSVIAVAVCAVLAALASPLSRLPKTCIQIIEVMSPPCLVVLGEYFPTHRFPDAQDYTAGAICYAFAFGISMIATRRSHPLTRLAGIGLSTIIITLIGYIASHDAYMIGLHFDNDRVIALVTGAIWFPTAVALARSRRWRDECGLN